MAFCPQCGSGIPDGTGFCPRCGSPVSGGAPRLKKRKKPLLRRWWFWVLLVAAVFLIFKTAKNGRDGREDPGRSLPRTEAAEGTVTDRETRESTAAGPAEGTEPVSETETDPAPITEPAPVTEPATETEVPPATAQHGAARPDSEIRQELIDFLDAYEAFMDEYIAFMDKYEKAEGTELLGLLKEYAEIMKRYRDFSERADAFDYGDMTLAESLYYAEAMSRISQKLLGSLDG